MSLEKLTGPAAKTARPPENKIIKTLRTNTLERPEPPEIFRSGPVMRVISWLSHQPAINRS
tara:strand:+ start:58 stop:240 length:183 start_codon:yes stop_codon:yes gene_type:complete